MSMFLWVMDVFKKLVYFEVSLGKFYYEYTYDDKYEEDLKWKVLIKDVDEEKLKDEKKDEINVFLIDIFMCGKGE